MKSFDRTGVFEIIDPPAFGAEVARQIAGFRRGMSGHCLYREDDSFLARAIDFDPERHRRPDGGVELSAPALAQQIGGDETVLLKSTRYRTQAEYRLMWELDRLDSDHLFVDAPSARQFCRRVEQLL
ncbi:MAG: hypothetical protein Q7T09_09070 [Phenylobacterium sp.]|nr:hypothetical protein [Phenylobacterium sp.]